jgi:hypothetical protein
VGLGNSAWLRILFVGILFGRIERWMRDMFLVMRKEIVIAALFFKLIF